MYFVIHHSLSSEEILSLFKRKTCVNFPQLNVSTILKHIYYSLYQVKLQFCFGQGQCEVSGKSLEWDMLCDSSAVLETEANPAARDSCVILVIILTF